MSLVLRKVKLNQWYPRINCPWLEENELHADPVVDLATRGNTLSVWVLDDRSNVERVMVALAASVDHVSAIDYVLFDSRLLDNLGIIAEEEAGATPDEEANRCWHRNLVKLSAQKLTSLATAILETGHWDRIPEKTVRERIIQGVDSGCLRLDKFKPIMRQKVELLLSRR
ncbi:MAG: hypothetical protein M5U01_09715 [Ardenticatenaceae bacterium]|nr:hypothetical protein [Ardenticatenaceae bacterium]